MINNKTGKKEEVQTTESVDIELLRKQIEAELRKTYKTKEEFVEEVEKEKEYKRKYGKIIGYEVTITPAMSTLENSRAYLMVNCNGRKIGGVYETKKRIEIPKEILNVLQENEKKDEYGNLIYKEWNYIIHDTIYE